LDEKIETPRKLFKELVVLESETEKSRENRHKGPGGGLTVVRNDRIEKMQASPERNLTSVVHGNSNLQSFYNRGVDKLLGSLVDNVVVI
jgi:hypothetical protein